MAEMDTNDNDKAPSTDGPESESSSQSEIGTARVSAWALNPAQAADPLRGMGWHHELRDNDDENLWSIPWANLMMVLFAIVFMLIGLQGNDKKISTTDRAGTVQQPPAVGANITTAKKTARFITGSPLSSTRVATPGRTAIEANKILLARIENAIATSRNNQISTTIIKDRSLRLTLASDMLFHANSAELTQQARIILEQLSQPLRDTPHHLHIIGHSDDQPVDSEIYADTWALSLAHAGVVARFLIDAGQLEAARFSITGRAQHEPLTSNLIASSRAKNRRVDILITLDSYPPAEKKS